MTTRSRPMFSVEYVGECTWMRASLHATAAEAVAECQLLETKGLTTRYRDLDAPGTSHSPPPNLVWIAKQYPIDH